MERYRITADAGIYFCTYSVVDWLPVFMSEQSCRIICDSLSFCHDQKFLCIESFVIMPTHLHLIVFDCGFQSKRLEQTLIDFRKFTGRKLIEHCQKKMPTCYTEVFAAAASDDRDHRFWQSSRHPEALMTERFHRQKRDYLHDNPRRKGLVWEPAAWRWSSARWYETGKDSDVPITSVIW